VVELRRGSSAPGREPDHALGAPAALRGWITHGGPDEALPLESIESGVKGTEGTSSPSDLFQLPPDGRAICLVAQSRTHAEHQVFEFPKHDYHHIVGIIAHHIKSNPSTCWLPAKDVLPYSEN